MAPTPAPKKPTYLIATDGSPEADEAVDYGISMAKRTGATVRVLCVAELTQEPMGIEPGVERRAVRRPGFTLAEANVKAAVGRARAARLGAEGRVVQAADPAVGIVREAEEVGADLIVLGSRGLTGIRRIVLGSVAEAVVERAHCPVLVVR
jgi:nucleotide-binding universal stress UspA family protein